MSARQDRLESMTARTAVEALRAAQAAGGPATGYVLPRPEGDPVLDGDEVVVVRVYARRVTTEEAARLTVLFGAEETRRDEP